MLLKDDTGPPRSLGDLALFFLVMWPIMIVANGAVGKLFWLWFVVPLGAPEISVAHAAGLGVVASSFTGTVTVTRKYAPEDFTSLASYGIYQLVMLAVVLATGAAVKLWLNWS